MTHKLLHWWPLLFVFLATPLTISAQSDDIDDLYSDEPGDDGGIAQSGSFGPQVILSGTIDFRVIQSGEAISWDRGGRGLTRYGGIDTDRKEKRDDLGDRESITFQLPQVSLVADMLISDSVSGFLQLNYDDHLSSARQSGGVGVVEGYLKYEKDLSENYMVTSRIGLLIPPISLEHPNVAWGTRYTITPSAINTWVGEELRMLALESSFRYQFNTLHSFEFTLAPFSGNDPSGSILAWRGWALHDYQLTTGARLRAQTIIPEKIGPNGGWIEPLKEIDGVMGYYTKMAYHRAEWWKVEMFYHDSLADQIYSDYSTMDYAWRTTFYNFSVEWTPFKNMTLLAQNMAGNTQMGERKNPAVDNDFDSWYTLASYYHEGHRLSFRYDDFQVKELDDWLADNNNMEGIAHTLAYLYEFNETHMIGAELVHVQSYRPGSEKYDSSEDPDDDLFQWMYRATF